jgi:TM2 domain-containing membrane protein YozV
MFGLDRFYLGYPAIGLLKLFTLGFVFIGQVSYTQLHCELYLLIAFTLRSLTAVSI